MATGFNFKNLGLEFVKAFTEVYKSTEDFYEREHRCEEFQIPKVLVAPRETDVLAGKRIWPEVGISAQYGGMGYYANFYQWPNQIELSTMDNEHQYAWKELRSFWEKEDISDYRKDYLNVLTNDIIHDSFN